jgi:hypothetical protein
MADEVYEGAIGIDLGTLLIPVSTKAIAVFSICRKLTF